MPIQPPPSPTTAPAAIVRPFHAAAPTPPMGWNSWDCFGTAVTETQVKANADYLAEHLRVHGYQYVVVDIQWYEPKAAGHDYRPGAELTTDGFGRLLPAVNRFPSAAGDRGFKPLADYVHGKGLRFGLHLMRGVPRQAADRKLPVLGTDATAADVADRKSTCEWNPDMYGVDVSKAAGQAYYDSVFKLLAGWGVDFVKVDDLSRPYLPHAAEIEAVRRAVDASGRPIVLSMSPGETPVAEAGHAMANANLWRISDDFWDAWPQLRSQFDRCAAWAPYAGPGHWPDADMLPVGQVRAAQHGWTKFTRDEQRTMLTLWCVARSPLMVGGNLTANDPFTLDLLSNDEVLAVDQIGTDAHPVPRPTAGEVVWVSTPADGRGRYLALFNLADRPAGSAEAGRPTTVDLADVGLPDRCEVRDLWLRRDLGTVDHAVTATVAWHGAALLRVAPPARVGDHP